MSARNANELIRFQEATAMHQAAEWGMHALKGSFPCLEERIQYEKNNDQLIMLAVAVLLYNFCCEKVGLNQLRNVFLPSWVQDPSDFFPFFA